MIGYSVTYALSRCESVPEWGMHGAEVAVALRVAIAEDAVLLREGLVRLLSESDFEVIAAVDNGDDLVAVIERERPDVSIVDIRMPPTFRDEGLRAAIEARRRVPHTPILVFSQYVEERYAAELLEGGTTGIGYLLKDRVADVREFVVAVRRVAAGGTVLDPEVVTQLVSNVILRFALDDNLFQRDTLT